MGTIGACRLSADNHIREAVAIYVSGRRHRQTAVIVGGLAVDLKSGASVETGKREICREGAGLAEHHIGGTGIRAVRSNAIRADDQIRKAIAIDIPSRGDRGATIVACRLPADLKAIGPV